MRRMAIFQFRKMSKIKLKIKMSKADKNPVSMMEINSPITLVSSNEVRMVSCFPLIK